MSNRWIVLVAVAFIVTLMGRGSTVRGEIKAEDGKTRSIEVEYHRPGGMQVTFFDDVKPEVRADFLKSELENYVRVFKPEANYLATAFDAAGKNLGGQMIYVHDSKRVMTLELYQQGR